MLFLLPGNIIAYSHQIYILSKIKKKRKPDSRKREINTKMEDEIPLTPLFYQMKRGKAMVSAIAIFIIAVNVYIYLKNKKDK